MAEKTEPKSKRITPPSWTEWTKTPGERSRSRTAFDTLIGELRGDGLVDTKVSLFMQLARFSYVQAKTARIDIGHFIESIPENVFNQISPAYRQGEVNGLLLILVEAGLCQVSRESGGTILEVLLTERQDASVRQHLESVKTAKAFLDRFYGRRDFRKLLGINIAFPTYEAMEAAAKTEGFELVSKDSFLFLEDHPETNEENPRPFLQQTLRESESDFAWVSFWPLPEPRAADKSIPAAARKSTAPPEFSILIPTEMELIVLIRSFCLPIIHEFLSAEENREVFGEIQQKYSAFQRQYQERFNLKGGMPSHDRIDRVINSSEPGEDTFTNAVYVLCQILGVIRTKNLTNAKYQGIMGSPVLYQAARIAYAYTMALKVQRRQNERQAEHKERDAKALIEKLRLAMEPMTLDEMGRMMDAAGQKELSKKYKSLVELLPLASPKEGEPAAVFEVGDEFVHRENLLLCFQTLRNREIIRQFDTLTDLWADEGIPKEKEMKLPSGSISSEFMQILDTVYRCRILAKDPMEFAKLFLPDTRDQSVFFQLGQALTPEGKKLPTSPYEVIIRSLDPLLFEDRDHLRRASYMHLLGLNSRYKELVKSTWDQVFYRDGLVKFILRKFLGLFGAGPRGPSAASLAKASAPKKNSSSKGKGGTFKTTTKVMAAPHPGLVTAPQAGTKGLPMSVQKQTQAKKLKEIAPVAGDRAQLTKEINVALDQWCFKIDKKEQQWTKEAVDDEIGRLIARLPLEEFSQDNGIKLAMFLVSKSKVLSQITQSRAFSRYIYLTALETRLKTLER